MKLSTQHFLAAISLDAIGVGKRGKVFLLFFLLLFSFQGVFSQTEGKLLVTGTVRDSAGAILPGVTVTEKGTRNGTSTDAEGNFSLKVANERSVLVFTYVGFTNQEQRVGNKTNVVISLSQAGKSDLGEVVVIGYGSRRKESLTGAISSVTAKDIDRVHAGSTVSSALAGKLPGVTFRMPDGRPGSSANIQIRNMGAPLYVIDGIQQDAGQFNNLAPNDIESITVLKDASAAIYGVRAANGVVVVTTKRGATGRNNVNVDAYAGNQYFFRFPKVLTSSYDYVRYRADAEVNSNIFNPDPSKRTAFTTAELELYQKGASSGAAYRSFDWRDYILNGGAAQNSVNVNISGGSDKVTYYVSGTNLHQASMLGKEYRFDRSNIQSNVTAKLATGLRVGMDINGRVETRQNPGVPGGDDYFLARLAVLRNTPRERPYANDNPNYLNDLGPHLESNYAFLNEKISGKLKSEWRVLQTNFNAEWQIQQIPGLSVRGVYSYYIADNLLNNQEYTYKAYTYIPASGTTPEEYRATGGSTNPWREREQIKQINTTLQGQISYNSTFGDNTVGATVVAERLDNHRRRNWLHASPISNNLPLIYFPTVDRYDDEDAEQARLGYIGRITYSYANRYFLEASARRDASYLFQPGSRVGYFPGVSAGWRLTEEPFFKNILQDNNILSDLKIRGSYGVLGDDNPNNTPIVAPYAYLQGYNYNQGTSILDGTAITVSRDQGVPITNITWLKSRITDLGLDFSLLNGKLSGTLDYFYRKRTGLLGPKSNVVLPTEVGFNLPQYNINSDAQYGGEASLLYRNNIGRLNFTVGGNVSYSRGKTLDVYNQLYNNSWDKYRTGSINRYTQLTWGYQTIGQFTSFEQINGYKVDIDGQGNSTLIPGDLIYKDQNGDGKIDGYDERPVGYGLGTQPFVNFGFNIGLVYRNFDFNADFSGAAGYTWNQNWELRWAFQNNGNLNDIFTDRWHRADVFDVNSQWIPGKYPANRYNIGTGHVDYGPTSSFWLHNVKQIRARTIQLGYAFSPELLRRIKVQRARLYLNAYNLFSLDNLRQYAIDPEISDDNGLQFPQNRVINIGINLSL
ncbi:MAG: TonB-dependent receptor [Williamsia sp.]|nr:TonB-dependent receptor [Williamsia sp.]